MKMYRVAKETFATAINTLTNKTRTFYTTHENHFTETLNDPIAYRNGRYLTPKSGRGPVTCNFINDQAENGFYSFPDTEYNTGWVLVVHSDYVFTE